VRPLQPVDRSVSRDSVVANSEETATSGRQAFKNVRFQMIANNQEGARSKAATDLRGFTRINSG